MAATEILRRRTGRAAGAAALALVALAGCTTGQSSASNYGEARENFLEGCIQVAEADNEAIAAGEQGAAGATRIATRKVKWDHDYRDKHGIRIGPAALDEALARKIARTSRRLSRALGLDGYVRIDYRLSPEGDLYFLEANPNPDIAEGDEFASACEARGLSYHEVLTRILHLARRR